MVNKSGKGQRYEREARKILEKEGYLTDFKTRSRYASNDFFGVFDILAIGEKTRLIQVKTNIKDFYTARKSIKKWVDEHSIKDITFEIWLREPRKEWRKEVIS